MINTPRDVQETNKFYGFDLHSSIGQIYTSVCVGVVAILVTSVPFFASAQQVSPSFSRQGIFGCGRNAAALSSSVGAFSATGGVYVPVADYTVELNTGTLVYLECVLRGIVNRESEAANAAGINKTLKTIVTGNGGNAFFSSDPDKEFAQYQDQSRYKGLQDQSLLIAMEPSFAKKVQRASAKSFLLERRNHAAVLHCPEIDPDATGLAALANLGEPACSAITAYGLYDDILAQRDAQYLANINRELEWGRGFYCVSHIDGNGTRICDTPSSYVEEQGLQAVTSGFRRIENANNVDQMVGALYAGLGTQVLTGSGGLLTGLTQNIGNSPSYLSQLTSESNAGLRNAAVNTALQILAGARNVEIQYFQTTSAIANSLTSTINQLRSIERQCWDLIAYNSTAKHVCAAPPVDNKCTSMPITSQGANGTTVTPGHPITIATSTKFSQGIIDAQITPVATQAIANVQKSRAAITLIDQLIQGVSNTSSLDAQRLALVQLDQLVAQGKLHVAADVTAAQQQQTAVADSMAQLIDQTKTLWADNADPNRGWCNVNSQSLIDFWDTKWR
jgi:hypothetical protein